VGSFLDARSIIDGSEDGDGAVWRFVDEGLERAGRATTGYGEDCFDLRGWELEELFGELEAYATRCAGD